MNEGYVENPIYGIFILNYIKKFILEKNPVNGNNAECLYIS